MALYKLSDQISGDGTFVSADVFIGTRHQKKRGILFCARSDPARLAFQLLVQGRHDQAYPYTQIEVITDAEMASGDGGLVFAKMIDVVPPIMRGGIKLATGPGTTSVWLYVYD